MAIVLTACVRDVYQTLNASILTETVGGLVSIDPKFPDDVVLARVTDAMNEFGSLVASVKDHPEQTQLASYTSALVHKSRLDTAAADKTGEFIGCRISFDAGPTPAPSTYEPAMQWNVDEIRRYRADATFIGSTSPWYRWNIQSGYLYHTGTFAILAYVPSSISAANVPAKYRNGIVSLALALLLPFEGRPDTIAAANHFRAIAEGAMMRIREGVMSPPPSPFAPTEGV